MRVPENDCFMLKLINSMLGHGRSDFEFHVRWVPSSLESHHTLRCASRNRRTLKDKEINSVTHL